MKAGELQPDDKFTLVDCEPRLAGVVYTVRRPWGNQMECWNEHTMRCYIPEYQEVQKVDGRGANTGERTHG